MMLCHKILQICLMYNLYSTNNLRYELGRFATKLTTISGCYKKTSKRNKTLVRFFLLKSRELHEPMMPKRILELFTLRWTYLVLSNSIILKVMKERYKGESGLNVDRKECKVIKRQRNWVANSCDQVERWLN